MNLYNMTMQPVNFYTPFAAVGELIFNTALTLFRFVSMPLWSIMNPKNFSTLTPKVHFIL